MRINFVLLMAALILAMTGIVFNSSDAAAKPPKKETTAIPAPRDTTPLGFRGTGTGGGGTDGFGRIHGLGKVTTDDAVKPKRRPVAQLKIGVGQLWEQPVGGQKPVKPKYKGKVKPQPTNPKSTSTPTKTAISDALRKATMWPSDGRINIVTGPSREFVLGHGAGGLGFRGTGTGSIATAPVENMTKRRPTVKPPARRPRDPPSNKEIDWKAFFMRAFQQPCRR